MPSDYIPILLNIVIAVGLAGALLLLTHLLGPRKFSEEKLDTYECGVPPIGSARLRFSVKFYLIAVLFVIFDIEAIFLYPWGVIFKRLLVQGGSFIFIEALVFIGILLAGLAYVWKKGALDWD
ncbi:MAG: NADH-quinone oxidoreductase subunit A [bacterium]